MGNGCSGNGLGGNFSPSGEIHWDLDQRMVCGEMRLVNGAHVWNKEKKEKSRITPAFIAQIKEGWS